MTNHHHLLAEMRRLLGDGHVLTDPEMTAGYATTWTGERAGAPLAVLRPGDAVEVRAAVRMLADAGVPIVPQGGNTGLAGGAAPADGEVIVNLRRLSSVAAAEGGPPAIVAGAGATLADVAAAAGRHGMEFPLDIGARAEATVGGMLATDAAGRHAWRHGSMRSLAARTEAVLADGTPVGGTTPGGGIGAVEGMFAGSEGGLGIITATRLRLIPRRPRRALAVVPVGGADDAALLARRAVALHPVEAVEMVFAADAIELLERHLGLAPLFDPVPEAVLFVEAAGGRDLPDVLAEVVDDDRALIGDDPATRHRLWRHREAISEITVGPEPAFKAAVGIPADHLVGFERSLRSSFPGHPLALFGHLSTGCFHVNLHGLPAGGHDAARDRIVETTIDAGGWIAAEHGFGRTYRPWLARVVPAPDLAAAGTIKAALDPDGVMNPGVGAFDASAHRAR